MTNALLAACWFYIFPILTGRAILSWFFREQSPYLIFAYYVTGGLVLYLLAFAVQLAGLLTRTGLTPALVLIGVVVIGINAVQIITRHKEYSHLRLDWKNVARNWILPLGLIVGLTVWAFAIWHWNTPAPLTLNWDIFEHQTLINAIRQGQFSFTASRISDTFRFDGYSTMFHWLITIPQAIFSPQPLDFWWVVEGFHLFLSITGVYVLAYSVTRNRFSASVAAIIGAFSFESYVAYSSLFLVPQTFAAVIFAFGMAYLLQKTPNTVTLGRKQMRDLDTMWLMPFLFLFLILSHYIVGAAAIAVLMGCIILQLLLTRWPKSYGVWLVLAPLGVFLVLDYIGAHINVASINGGEALQYLYPVSKLIDFMQVFFGFSLVALVPFGTIMTFRLKNNALRILTVAGAVIIAIIMSGIPYALKFYVLGHYLTSVLMAIGICFWIHPGYPRVCKYVALGIIACWFSTHLVLNSVYWKNDLHYGFVTTHVSRNEIEAARFLKSRYGNTNTLIVSDPSTQYVAEALSGVNSQGGAYMKETTRTLVASLVQSRDATTASEILYAVSDTVQPGTSDTVILVLSGRFFQWLEKGPEKQQDVSFNIWTPAILSPGQEHEIEQMIPRYGFRRVFENSDMVIVEVAKPATL